MASAKLVAARSVGSAAPVTAIVLLSQRHSVTRSWVSGYARLLASVHALAIAGRGTRCAVKDRRSIKSGCGASGEKKD